MIRVALGTSVVVAGPLRGHAQHRETLGALQLTLAGEPPALPLPALLETYAVLTRLPPNHRLSAEDARRALDGTFRGRARIVALTGEEGFTLVRACADAGHTGGLLYDAHVAACARKAGARRILTFNRRDRERIATDLEIVSP